MSLLFKDLVNQMQIVQSIFELGAEKYGRKNWQLQLEHDDHFLDALLRHLQSYMQNPKTPDKESGQSHIYHIIATALIMAYHEEQN